MGKKVRTLLYILIMCFSLCGFKGTAFAYTEYVSGYFRYILEEGSITITGYNGRESEVTIPPEITGMPVNTIASGAFYKASKVVKINLPDTIMTIEEGAFAIGQEVVYNSNMNDTIITEPGDLPEKLEKEEIEPEKDKTEDNTTEPGKNETQENSKEPDKDKIEGNIVESSKNEIAENNKEPSKDKIEGNLTDTNKNEDLSNKAKNESDTITVELEDLLDKPEKELSKEDKKEESVNKNETQENNKESGKDKAEESISKNETQENNKTEDDNGNLEDTVTAAVEDLSEKESGNDKIEETTTDISRNKTEVISTGSKETIKIVTIWLVMIVLGFAGVFLYKKKR